MHRHRYYGVLALSSPLWCGGNKRGLNTSQGLGRTMRALWPRFERVGEQSEEVAAHDLRSFDRSEAALEQAGANSLEIGS